MVAKILICQSASCASSGAALLVRDVEELAQGNCAVEEYGCLGRCGKGPNVELQMGTGKKKIVEGVNSFRKALALVQDEAECNVSDKVKKLGKIKYDIRRETNPDLKEEKLKEAFDSLGGEKAATSEPMLFSTLLVLRSRFLLKTQIDSALQDAERAVKLVPQWPQAHLALASALEACRRFAEGVNALESALELKSSVNMAAVKRHLTRMQRQAQEQVASQSASEPPAPEPLDPDPMAALSRIKVAKPKSGAAKGTRKAQAKQSGAAKIAPLPSNAEATSTPPAEQSDFVEWHIDSVAMLNHDCLCIVMKTCDVAALARQPDCGDVWHVDILKEGPFGQELKRSYTPVSSAGEYVQGRLEFMVKVYPDGKMTSYLAGLRPGSIVLVSKPCVTLAPEQYRGVIMVAGGSAVTVALQVCQAVLKRIGQEAPVRLFLCNRSVDDVLYQDVFECMLLQHLSFSLVHCISDGRIPRVPFGRSGRAIWLAGRITDEILSSTEPHLKCVVSGPVGLCQAALDIWAKLKRSADDLKILDELPQAQDVGESATREDVQFDLHPVLDFSQEDMPCVPAVVPKAKHIAPENMSCRNIFGHFWCSGRQSLDQDDAE